MLLDPAAARRRSARRILRPNMIKFDSSFPSRRYNAELANYRRNKVGTFQAFTWCPPTAVENDGAVTLGRDATWRAEELLACAPISAERNESPTGDSSEVSSNES